MRIKQISLTGRFAVVGKKSVAEDVKKKKKRIAYKWKGIGIIWFYIDIYLNFCLFVPLTATLKSNDLVLISPSVGKLDTVS